MLQLSYSLNAEAPEGRYDINVWNNGLKMSQNFKVEKYSKLHLTLLFYVMPMTIIIKTVPFPQFFQNMMSK